MFGRVRSWLRGSDPPAALAPDRALIVPRVRNIRCVERLMEVARERDVVPVEPLVGELVVAYGFDRPGCYQMLALRDLVTLGLEREGLRALALENAVRIAGGRFIAERVGPLLEIVHPLATTSLLVRNFWEAMEEVMEGPLAVGVPRLDVVVACRLDDTDAVSLLATMLADDDEEDGPAPSAALLVRVDGAWELLEETDD